MVWGSINGWHGRGSFLFWEKNWGSINAHSFSERIVPLIDEYLRSHPYDLLQQDNCGGHSSSIVQNHLHELGWFPIFWPPFSPDLNPIEDIWKEIKKILLARDSRVHCSYKRLRKALNDAWESIDLDFIRGIISDMPNRCQAVIDADGSYTKY
jgi:hypothetical protein